MTVAATLVNQLLLRVRDASGTGLATSNPPTTGSGQAFALKLISYAQNFINAWEEQVIVTAPLSIQPYQGIFPISSTFVDTSFRPLFSQLIGIRDEANHSIPGPQPFRRLAHVNLKWMLEVSGRIRMFCLFGKDTLIIYPTLDRATTITAVGVQNIPDLMSMQDALTLTDDMLPQVMDVAEALALFKMRQLDVLKPVLDRLVGRYKAEQMVNMWVEKTVGKHDALEIGE